MNRKKGILDRSFVSFGEIFCESSQEARTGGGESSQEARTRTTLGTPVREYKIREICLSLFHVDAVHLSVICGDLSGNFLSVIWDLISTQWISPGLVPNHCLLLGTT